MKKEIVSFRILVDDIEFIKNNVRNNMTKSNLRSYIISDFKDRNQKNSILYMLFFGVLTSFIYKFIFSSYFRTISNTKNISKFALMFVFASPGTEILY